MEMIDNKCDKDEEYKCNLCDQKFTRSDNLKRHIQNSCTGHAKDIAKQPKVITKNNRKEVTKNINFNLKKGSASYAILKALYLHTNEEELPTNMIQEDLISLAQPFTQTKLKQDSSVSSMQWKDTWMNINTLLPKGYLKKQGFRAVKYSITSKGRDLIKSMDNFDQFCYVKFTCVKQYKKIYNVFVYFLT